MGLYKTMTFEEYECSDTLRYELLLIITPNELNNTYSINGTYYLDNTKQFRDTIAASTQLNYIQIKKGTHVYKEYYYEVPKITRRGKHILCSFTLDSLEAEDEVEKLISIRCSHFIPEFFEFDSGWGYDYPQNIQTFSVTLDPIMRKNKGTIDGDIELEKEVNITITREIDGTSHKIGYNFGGETTWFYEGKSLSVPLTLPMDLASLNKSGTTLNMQLVTETIYDGSSLGEATKTYVCNIPETVKPSCTVEVKDGEAVDGVRIFEKYGAYVQRKSRLNVVITPVLAYDSPIVTCSAVVNGSTYVDEYEFETGVLKYSGEQSITVTLTDQRGRIGEVVIPINVLEYQKPSVSNVNISRCDVDGTANSSGGYLKVTFDAEITPLNGMNSASYELEYQTTSGLHQDGATLTEYAGLYSVSGGSFIFAADNNSVYTAVITAIDDLDKGAKSSGRSLITVLMNILASGLGLAFGTIAGLENVFESAFKFFPSGGFMFPTLEAGSDIYGIKTPNIYSIEEGQDIEHFPVDGSCTLIVLPGGGTKDLLHIVITGTPEILIARITDSSWSSWYRIGMTEVD